MADTSPGTVVPGTLYIVATPIGNLDDVTLRALAVLRCVDAILAEDTRRTARLLERHGIRASLLAYHEHNEQAQVPRLLARLDAGESLALVSDAGTPLVSDPGFPLVRALADAGRRIVPIPGPSALLAALAVCGLPTDRFVFEGFLPSRSGARGQRLAALADEPRTMVFFEAPHRLDASLAALATAFGGGRPGVVARELTKVYESVERGSLSELQERVRAGAIEARGEIAVVVAGRPAPPASPERLEPMLRELLAVVPLKTAVDLAARLSGEKRNSVYRTALALGREPADDP